MSGVLHVLLHMAQQDNPATSEMLAKAMQTNPVVIRRIMAGLRERGYVRSEKGHGGGWTLACDLSQLTLRDVTRRWANLRCSPSATGQNLPAASSSRR